MPHRQGLVTRGPRGLNPDDLRPPVGELAHRSRPGPRHGEVDHRPATRFLLIDEVAPAGDAAAPEGSGVGVVDVTQFAGRSATATPSLYTNNSRITSPATSVKR